jgi:hypothetical protein
VRRTALGGVNTSFSVQPESSASGISADRLKTDYPFRRFVLSSSAVVTLLSGCAIADFTPYSAQQQNWPTQPGSFVNTGYAIPAYISSYPNRPYNVIDYLDATTAPVRRRGVVAFAARRAKELGADAIIVLAEGQEYAGALSTGNTHTTGFVYRGGFNATTTGTSFAGALIPRKSQSACYQVAVAANNAAQRVSRI